jgi:hypothetical protein
LAAEWPTSVIFARVLPSAFLFVARASFFPITTAFTLPVAVTTICAFPITVRETLAVVSFSPATVSLPVPFSTITSVAFAMVLA